MPVDRQALVQRHLDRAQTTTEGVGAVRGLEETVPKLTVGDIIDIDPEVAEREGLTGAAEVIRKARETIGPAATPGRLGGPNNLKASAFDNEWGTQAAANLRQIPLQRMSGAMGLAPAQMETRLKELHFLLKARREGYKSSAMPVDEYGRILDDASNEARKDVASVMGASEERGNVIVDPDADNAVAKIKRGEDMPLLLKATPFGMYPTLASWWEQAGGAKVEDQTIMKIMAPIYALARPGTASVDVQTGAPIVGGAKESKLWWFLRLGYTTPLYSWAFDPSLTWELGGENGWGGTKHIQKIVSGDDGGQEILNYTLPAMHKAGEDPSIGNLASVALRISVATAAGMAMVFEPDAGSGAIATLGSLASNARRLPARVIDGVYMPALESWKQKLMDNADWTSLADGLHENSPLKILWDGVKNETEARAAAEAYDEVHKLGALSQLNEANMKNAQKVEVQAADMMSTANTEAVRSAVKGREAVNKVDQARAHIAMAHDEAADAHEKAARLAAKELNAALDEYQTAEAGLVTGTALRGTRGTPAAGQRVYDWKTGEVYQVVNVNKRGVRVTDQGGVERILPPSRLRHFAEMKDSKAVFDELSRIKRVRDQMMVARRAAVDAGDVAKVIDIDKKMAGITSKMIANINDTAHNAAHAAYLSARARIEKASEEAFRLWGTSPPPTGMAGATKYVKKHQALVQAVARLDAAMDKVAARKRQLEAIRRLPHILMEVIDDHLDAGKRISANLKAGVEEQAAAKNFVVNTVARQVGNEFKIDPAELRKAVVDRYGEAALNEALAQPTGRPFRNMFGSAGWGPHKIDVEVLGHLRDFEKSIHAAAERARLLPQAQASTFLRTLADTKGVAGWSRESWLAWGYQTAQRLSRAGDFISASTIGRAAPAIRESVRRSIERYYQGQKELGHIASTLGLKGFEDYLTSTTVMDGVIGNRDTVTIADKCLSYLRSIADGEWWAEDVVVKAMSTAPLASGQVAPVSAGVTRTRLQELVADPTTTGADLWRWLEKDSKNIYYALTGRHDTPEVMMRFFAQAMVQGANQHDTMYDIWRIAGTNIDAKSANALNWMITGENIGSLGKHTAADAYKAMSAYGLPRASDIAGKVERFYRAKLVQNKLIHIGTIEGKDHFMPRMVLEALNEVPRNLAKEMREFADTSRLEKTIAQLSLIWRVATVNGWILPRGAHWLNTFVGDWAQMTTSVGLKEATIISLNAMPTYMPIVGPALQSRLASNSLLGALFDPNLAKVMEGRSDVIIHTGDGAVSARRFLQEAYEDGCWDSINTKDLIEATSRSMKRRWDWVTPPHIEATAKMLEEAQHRSRTLLYLRLRNQGMTRQAAKAKMIEALYDWKTGVPEWEHMLIGRLMTFWTYRRGMTKQLGASLTEGLSKPGTDYWTKALTGRTNLARMRNQARAVELLPDAINWQDPDEQLDDEEQLDVLGKRTAPWWRTAQTIFGSRQVDPTRKLWFSEVTGKHVTYESIMLPTLTTLDQLHMLNVVLQTGAATTVMLAEELGLTSMTTIRAEELVERNIDTFADQLYPYAEGAISGALKQMAGVGYTRGGEYAQGVPLSEGQVVMLKRLGFEDFMGAKPDADGRWRIDAGAYGVVTSLMLNFPPVNDFARNWAIFDNPGHQESFLKGVSETMARWTGLFAPKAHDPFASRDYEAQAKERELKSMASGLEKQTTPKDMRHR